MKYKTKYVHGLDFERAGIEGIVNFEGGTALDFVNQAHSALGLETVNVDATSCRLWKARKEELCRSKRGTHAISDSKFGVDSVLPEYVVVDDVKYEFIDTSTNVEEAIPPEQSNEWDLFVLSLLSDESFARPPIPATDFVTQYSDCFFESGKRGSFVDTYLYKLKAASLVQNSNGASPIDVYMKSLTDSRKIKKELWEAAIEECPELEEIRDLYEPTDADFDTKISQGVEVEHLKDCAKRIPLYEYICLKISETPPIKTTFMDIFQAHCNDVAEALYPDRKVVKCGKGDTHWPVNLVATVVEEEKPSYFRYEPRSDTFVSFWDIPHFIAEYESGGSQDDDLSRLYAQSYSLVQLVNKFRGDVNFILMSTYFFRTGAFMVFVFFQETLEGPVRYYSELFNDTTRDHLRYVRWLYGFLDAIDLKEDLFKNAREMFGKLGVASKELRSFTNTTRAEDNTGNDRPAGGGGSNTGNQDSLVDSFVAEGYKLVPGSKVPENTPVLEDAKGRVFVVKAVVSERQLKILQRLKAETARPWSDDSIPAKWAHHVICHERILDIDKQRYILLSKRHSVEALLDSPRTPSGGLILVRFSRGLLRGLSFLHSQRIAHLGIKPSNLAYDADLELQITNFDVAVMNVEEYCKFPLAEDWQAPEAKQPYISYCPFSADKYSCGLVIQTFADRARNLDWDKSLTDLAKGLTAHNPQRRASMREWLDKNDPGTDSSIKKAEGKSLEPQAAGGGECTGLDDTDGGRSVPEKRGRGDPAEAALPVDVSKRMKCSSP